MCLEVIVALRVGHPGADNIIARKVHSLSQSLYVSKHLAPNVSLENVHTFDKIAFKIPGTQKIYDWRFVAENSELREIRLDNARVISDSIESLIELCLGGVGLALIPDYLVRDHLKANVGPNALEKVLADCQFPQVEVYLCYFHREHLPCRVRVFIDFLYEHLKNGLPE